MCVKNMSKKRVNRDILPNKKSALKARKLQHFAKNKHVICDILPKSAWDAESQDSTHYAGLGLYN